MYTLLKPRPAVQPVHGSARWLTRPTMDCPGQLAIRTERGLDTLYEVHMLLAGDQGEHLGWELRKLSDPGTVYHIDVTAGWLCDCADPTFRQRPCKHVLGLQHGLKMIGSGV